MKKRELSDDVFDIIEEPEPSRIVELLNKFNVEEYWEKGFIFYLWRLTPDSSKSLFD